MYNPFEYFIAKPKNYYHLYIRFLAFSTHTKWRKLEINWLFFSNWLNDNIRYSKPWTWKQKVLKTQILPWLENNWTVKAVELSCCYEMPSICIKVSSLKETVLYKTEGWRLTLGIFEWSILDQLLVNSFLHLIYQNDVPRN